MAVTKIDSSMLEDVGGANNLVKLDSNAKIPAGPAGGLSVKPGPFTNASDPAVDSNKTLGFEWLNSTSGEMYICTDATAGANVWINVGAGTGDIQKLYQGTQKGFTSGSGDPTTLPPGDTIDWYSFTSDGNATDHANCSALRAYPVGHSSSTYGYISGGQPSYYIEKYPFASQTNGVSTGYNLSTGSATRDYPAGTSDTNYGYSSGGYTTTYINVIDRFSYSTDGTATDVGDSTVSGFGAAGASSTTHGYNAGRSSSGGIVNVIEKFAFGSSANATDVGDLTTVISKTGGHQSETHGYKSRGYSTGYTSGADSIQKWSFASDANATNVGTTTVGKAYCSHASSSTYGYVAGGTPSQSNVIEKFAFETDSNGTDVGDLTAGRAYMTGQQY